MKVKFKVGDNVFVINEIYFGEDGYHVEITPDKYNFAELFGGLGFGNLGSNLYNALKISFTKIPTYEDIYKTLLGDKDRLDKYVKDGVWSEK